MPMPSVTSAEPKRFALGASQDCRTVKVDGVELAYDDRDTDFQSLACMRSRMAAATSSTSLSASRADGA